MKSYNSEYWKTYTTLRKKYKEEGIWYRENNNTFEVFGKGKLIETIKLKEEQKR